MSARFKVLDVFQITDRGRVVAGEVLEGKVRIGMLAGPESGVQHGKWRIGGVEFADNVAARESHVALVLPDAPPLAELRSLLPAGSVLVIEDAPAGHR